MNPKELVRKERITEYLDNIERQIEDIRSISVPSKTFFLEKKNTIRIKAIKLSKIFLNNLESASEGNIELASLKTKKSPFASGTTRAKGDS
jgi:hypothetical protein